MDALSRIVAETHPVQLSVLAAAACGNLMVLVLLNRSKGQEDQKAREAASAGIPWSSKRLAYWGLIAALVGLSWWLDVWFELHWLLVPVKAYVMAFPLGLLDLHFSATAGVPLKVIAGAGLWCSATFLRWLLINAYFGFSDPVTAVQVREASIAVVLREAVRFIVSLPFLGILADLIFSPMHRLSHHPRVYSSHHKEHHEYTNKLTALVLYHGSLLDDFLMPLTTSFGGAIWAILLGCVGLERQAYSNLMEYLIIFNTLLSHAHDTRCARLMAPLPDQLNFVAYHYVHHLSPVHNFGLTEPSDRVWDWLLGVNTVRKLQDFEALKQG
ncbi:unnamed protein product [Effrenium voratum]|nr:unnamed protein product [Effrenium voratum]